MIFAAGGVRVGLGLRECREQQRGQNGNNGDHQEEFRQRQSRFRPAVASHIGLDTSTHLWLTVSRQAFKFIFGELIGYRTGLRLKVEREIDNRCEIL